jgi:hypothetical protein
VGEVAAVFQMILVLRTVGISQSLHKLLSVTTG